MIGKNVFTEYSRDFSGIVGGNRNWFGKFAQGLKSQRHSIKILGQRNVMKMRREKLFIQLGKKGDVKVKNEVKIFGLKYLKQIEKNWSYIVAPSFFWTKYFLPVG